MKPIAIYGAGGFGRETLMLIRQINLAHNVWKVKGFFDDGLAKGTDIQGLTVLGGMNELNSFSEEINLVIAVGDAKVKKKIAQKIYSRSVKFAKLIHPSVQIEGFQEIMIGEGSIITAGNILTTNIKVGKHAIINLSCSIGHDVVVGDYCSIMPCCSLSGNVTLGEAVYLGSGAVVINGINIGDNALVGAGAVVIHDVHAGSTVVGVPAREVIKNQKS